MNNKIRELIYTLTEHERKILLTLQKSKKHTISFSELKKLTGLSDAEISRATLWLENKGIAKRYAEREYVYSVTDKGKRYLTTSLPETRLFEALKKQGEIDFEAISRIGLSKDETNISIGILVRLGIAKVEKKDSKRVLVITPKGKNTSILPTEEIFGLFRKNRMIPVGNAPKNINLLVTRGLLRKTEKTTWILKLTELGNRLIEHGIPEVEFIEQLTPEIISSGAWRRRIIRWYDVEAWTPKIWGGRKNPLRYLMEKIRHIFISMGFREMRSNWVETEFWCFDSMWIPQDHPAREMQSTFWLEKPSSGFIRDKEILARVKEVQENGGDTGSTGWRLPWSENIAKRCILRTHTTATTFRVLGYGIKTGKIKPPVKFFAIGRVFRNETIDWKHLAEFHQIEGFVIAPNLTLRSLMGYIREFYWRMGIKKLRFKPTYNPYTEPSMEIFAWHKKTGRWVEVGNSGMFRPETLAPYGVKWPTIAWGLALERMAMLIWDIEDIRKVLGPSVDLDWIRNYRFPELTF